MSVGERWWWWWCGEWVEVNVVVIDIVILCFVCYVFCYWDGLVLVCCLCGVWIDGVWWLRWGGVMVGVDCREEVMWVVFWVMGVGWIVMLRGMVYGGVVGFGGWEFVMRVFLMDGLGWKEKVMIYCVLVMLCRVWWRCVVDENGVEVVEWEKLEC